LANSGSATTDRLVITGGTVENTSDNGTTIYNDSQGAINVSGGTVSAIVGMAIYNSNSSNITVSGSAIITSAISSTWISGSNVNATICIGYGNTGTINITGGMVENTGTDKTAVVVQSIIIPVRVR